MGMPSDVYVSALVMCRFANVRRQTRESWVKRDLLRKQPRDEYKLRDVLDLVACRLLHDALGPSDGRDAWRQVRDELSKQLPAPEIDVVFSEADHRATVARSEQSLYQLVRLGTPVRVITVGPELCRVREAVERYRSGRVADVGNPSAGGRLDQRRTDTDRQG
jgi:hypothetical protein